MFKKLIITVGLLASTFGITYAKYGIWGLNDINIISRQERGADETCRMSDNKAYDAFKKAEENYLDEVDDSYKSSTGNTQPVKTITQIRNEYLQNNFLNEIKIDKTITGQNNQDFWRPESFHYNKTKFVVHHTASLYGGLKTQDDVKTFLQRIYKYHAISNGRGDIGYNFVIDQFGNIYEGRDGGTGVIAAHDRRNNADSVGIAMLGNFNEEKPTESAVNSLVALLAALNKKYGTNPYDKKVFHIESNTYPYLKDVTLNTIIGHKDAGKTACPGANLYSRLDEIRNRVNWTLQNGYDQNASLAGTYGIGNNNISLVSSVNTGSKSSTPSKADEVYIPKDDSGITTNSSNTTSKTDIINLSTGNNLETLKNNYITKTGWKKSPNSIQKIQYKISKDEAKKLMSQNVKVMLYEASTTLTGWNFSCTSGCDVYLDTKKYSNIKSLNMTQNNSQLLININGKKISAKEVSLYPYGGLISLSNYNRKSYAGVPRNLFRGNMHIKKDNINILSSGVKNQYVIINELSFDDYMKGIGEISEAQSIEKIKAMSLIIKDYVLFYLNKKNVHPSIPANTKYNAVDDARIFQKYVGYGYEGVSKKWFQALDITRKQIILYNNYIPILPYFNCSAGFTWSGKEKYGWTDTPYLQSVLDFNACTDFNGHGVGLSGQGAQKMAENGKTYKDIINYYYSGVNIQDLN